MTVENRTCAERINEQWESRRDQIGDFAFFMGGAHWDCEYDEGGVCCNDGGQANDNEYYQSGRYDQYITEEYGEEALTDPSIIIDSFVSSGAWVEYESEFVKGAIHRPYFRIEMGGGGPSDELRIFHDRIEYWFLDWFDGASIDVTHDHAVGFLINWFSEEIKHKDEY